MSDWRPETVRAAIAMAQASLENVRPEDELTLARAALERAIEVLDASAREVGVFRETEPYRLVLDPPPSGGTPLALSHTQPEPASIA